MDNSGFIEITNIYVAVVGTDCGNPSSLTLTINGQDDGSFESDGVTECNCNYDCGSHQTISVLGNGGYILDANNTFTISATTIASDYAANYIEVILTGK